MSAVQSFVLGASAACPNLDVKLIVKEPLQQILWKVVSVSNVGAGDQSRPAQPQPAAVSEVCTAVDAQCADELANALDTLATELASDDGLPSAVAITGSTARLAAFCKLLAADSQPHERRRAADEEGLVKAWAQACDQLGAMTLPDATAGLRWLLHDLPCPLPIPTAAGELDTAEPTAAPLSAAARGTVVRDAAAVLSDVLGGAQASHGKATAEHDGAAVTGDGDRAAAASLLQELRMKVLSADAVATVQAQCALPEAGLALVEAALELAAEGADGLEAALPECLQV